MKVIKTIGFGLLIGFSVIRVWAQVPSPAPSQVKPIAVTGATIHAGDGKVFQNSILYFSNGRIDSIGESGNTNAAYIVVKAQGKHIYPGLIAMGSILGLNEIDAVRATLDFAEVGKSIPNVRALPAFNTESEILPTVKQNGVLMAQITPYGHNFIGGSSSIVQLDAWNWEDAAIKADEGLHLFWPGSIKPDPNEKDPEAIKNQGKAIEARQKTLSEFEQQLKEAANWSAGGGNKDNHKLKALSGLFSGLKTLYLHTNLGRDIIESVQYAQKLGVKKIVVIGAEDALRVTTFLKENNIPVVLGSLHRLPQTEEDAIDGPYRLAAQLVKEGILTAISFQGEGWKTRNLPFLAGTAAAYGLDKEQALQLITQNPAKIMGIDKQTGTIAKGLDATFVISNGDLLDMRTNKITKAYIQGRDIVLDGKQPRLYRKYAAKYGIQE